MIMNKKRILYQINIEDKKKLYERFLSEHFTNAEILEYTNELFNFKYWQDAQEIRKKMRLKYGDSDLAMFTGTLQVLYCIIRKFRPSIMVETGVHFGLSSLVFTCGLVKNKKGKLISIDNWNNEDCGCYVPKRFDSRWKLIKGRSEDILPKLKTKKIDIFCHDSDHSYKTQLFEYEWAIRNIKKDGLIFSHDLGASNAWFDFTKKYNLEYYLIKTATEDYSTGITKIKTPNHIKKYLDNSKGEWK